MKYYELYADCYWLSGKHKLEFNEITVIKETPKQLDIQGSRSYINKFNKSRLMQVQEHGASKFIIFPEGKEDEARKLLKETLERELKYFERKVEMYKGFIKEISNGKEKHN